MNNIIVYIGGQRLTENQWRRLAALAKTGERAEQLVRDWLVDMGIAASTDALGTSVFNHFMSWAEGAMDVCEHGYAVGCRACDPDR